jgi:glycine betaine/proline transport system substrate-binding protein
MVRRYWARAAAAAVMSSWLALSGASAQVPESDEPIKLAMNEWTSQHAVTQIAGKLLEKMGYNVEYVTVGFIPQFQAIADGSVDATLEIWEVNLGDVYWDLVNGGEIDVIGPLGFDGGANLYYPAAAADACPGLPDWQALKACTDVFATPDTFPQGRLLDYPPDWGEQYGAERMAAFDLDFTVVPAGSEGALVAEMRSAVERGEPLLLHFWYPHWVFQELDMVAVELPEYAPECTTDPAWGVNPDATWDCGYSPVPVVKVVSPAMATTWPAALRLLEALSVSLEDDIALMYAIDHEDRDLSEATDEWIANNEAVWQPWVNAATGQ